MNGMQDWLITFTLSSEGYFNIAGKEMRSKAGEIAILKSRIPHEYGTRKGQVWNFVWAHFSPKLEEIKWAQLPEVERGFILLKVDNVHLQKRIFRAFKRIILDSRQGGTQANELCINALNEILLLISNNTAKPLDPRITKVIHLLTTQLTVPIQVEQLAKTIGL